MRELIENFPKHIAASAQTASQNPSLPLRHELHEIVVTGLGGSGIGGKVISQWVASNCSVPVLVNNDYNMPAYVDANTLVIICSYSGNTEETLSALKMASEQGAMLAAISSGGQLTEFCKENDVPCIAIPPGNPPRSMFAYSSIQIISLLASCGAISGNHVESLKQIAASLTSKQPEIEAASKALAKKLIGTTPVLYANSDLEGVAVRWRQQINENGKMLCWHHVFPEMNHNELVGWENGSEDLSVILLRSAYEHPRTSIRMEISKGIFARSTSRIFEVHGQGESPLEEIFYLIHFGDWLSLHLAELTDTDPMDIRNIDFLKAELSAIP